MALLAQLPLAPATDAAPAFRPVPTALHVHSTWSTGNLSLDDLASLARVRGIEAVFLADNHLQRFEYGVFPLRGVLRHRIDYPSIVSAGPEAFLRAVETANARHKDVLVIPGVEVVPHYFWTGSLLDGTLTMHNAQKNLLALGLYRPEDYREMPVVGNAGAAPWSLWSLWLASPALLAIPGIWLLRTRHRRVIRLRHFRVTEERRRIVPGVLCLLAGILLLANNYPFRTPPVSAYDSRAGLAPHQDVIDFVAARRGLAVWSLPEARDYQVVSVKGLRVTVRTDPYPGDLLRTDRFIAFAGLYEDTTAFTRPGHGWDQLLLDYLHGRRARPAWAVGEAAYHYEGQAGKRLGDVQTVLLSERSDAIGLLEALRSGRAYCRLRTDDENLALERFQVLSPKAESAEAGSRLTLEPGDRPEVHAAIGSATGRRLSVEVRLIRSGSVVQTFRGDTPVALRWTERPLPPESTLYYRLEARGPAGLQLLSNPIFVQASRGGTR
ncbi:MAG: hypothetical protein A2Z31_08125 [candidate division NC10 bacterium RBG_16_65_8]|nr:MAG: hypothetical protein A2Z31_08125 [candidate division NC10 bacterium RBG_16_65_8]